MVEEENDDYEYFETPEDVQEDSRESYTKRMIKDSKDQDGQFRRPDYKPGSISKDLDDKEYDSKPEEPSEEKVETKERKKDGYEL